MQFIINQFYSNGFCVKKQLELEIITRKNTKWSELYKIGSQ